MKVNKKETTSSKYVFVILSIQQTDETLIG